MPDGQGLQIYGAYKQRQQVMRNKLLDLMGQQIQTRTQEGFYRTRPAEIERGEYYRTGAEEREQRTGLLTEQLESLRESERKEKEATGLFIERKAELLEDPTLTPLEKSYLGSVRTHEGLIDFLGKRQQQQYGLSKMREAERLKPKPTELEKLQDIRQTIEEKEKITDLTNEQRNLLKSTREAVEDLDDYIETRYIKIGIEPNEDDPVIKRYVKTIKDNEDKIFLIGFNPELYKRLNKISLRTPKQEREWREQYNILHPEAPLPLVRSGGLLGTPIKKETEKFWLK